MRHVVFALGFATVVLGLFWFAAPPPAQRPKGKASTSPNVTPPATTAPGTPPSSARESSTLSKAGLFVLPVDRLDQENVPRMIRLKELLALAKTDEERLKLVEEEAKRCVRSEDLANARTSLEAGLATVESPEAKGRLTKAVRDLEVREAEERVRVAALQKEIEQVRLRGHLEFMKENLEKAKHDRKPSQDIQSLEAVVRKLEQEIAEGN